MSVSTTIVLRRKRPWLSLTVVIAILALIALPPLADLVLPPSWRLTGTLIPVLALSFLALGLCVITGFGGVLHLGAAAMAAVGAYAFGVFTTPIFPFAFGFWSGWIMAVLVGGLAGAVLALPLARLRGDYIAVVTLGFGEIVIDVCKNLTPLTKGTQGLSSLPGPTIPFLGSGLVERYAVVSILATATALVLWRIGHGSIGRSWRALRDDELATSAAGLNTGRIRLIVLTVGSALCAAGGALWAAQLGSTGDPGGYDYQLSVMALSCIILGGIGNVPGAVLGAVLVLGLNGLVLTKIGEALARAGVTGDGGPWLVPGNWKYAVYGVILLLMMRLRPQGLLPARESA